MLAALPGPGEGEYAQWVKEPVALGWRRSACEVAERAASPRVDAASRVAVAASTRLDGRDDLCEALGIPVADRAGLHDSALLLKSYARWGRACPEHLLGDYAFALWDAKQDLLFCARDHIGARPFYYAFVRDYFVFASDMDAVLAAPGVSGVLDEAAVATQLTYGSRFLGERTFYRAVRRLLPGHALSVEQGAERLQRWWRPEEVPMLPAASDDALAEQCLTILSEAVRDRVWDACSVGVHLSGGLDSSAIAVLAAREMRRQGLPAPRAFAWQPPPGPGGAPETAEHGAIDAVRRQEDLELLYQQPDARDVVAYLRGDGTRNPDDGTLLHELVVQRAAADLGVDLLLSGWGGDEGISFGGNGYYRHLLRSGRVLRLWRELGERSQRPVAALVTQAAAPLVFPGARRVLRRLWRGKRPFRENVTFINPGFARDVRLLPAGPGLPRAGMRAVQLHRLQSGHLSRRLEAWAASGARHGIEYRYPLLDRRVLEFALGLPAEQYRRGRWSRWLMRRALDPILPPEVGWNPSTGDPARTERYLDAVEEALPTVRLMIEKLAEPPPRSHYLDLPRLLEHMDPERWPAGRRFSPVRNALRFLDF